MKIVFFTSVGVLAVWASWGTGRLGVKYLSKVLADVGCSKNQLLVVELVFTLVFGVLFAVTFVEPATAKQAIAAGMGWTSFLTRPVDPEKPK